MAGLFGLVSVAMFCWGWVEEAGLVGGGLRSALAGQLGQPASSKPEPLSPSATSKVQSSGSPEKGDSNLKNASEPSGAESQWLTDLLRQEFQRWLTTRSEALFNQLQAEFGQWLALRGSQSKSSTEDSGRPPWVDAPPGVIDGQYWQTVQAGPASSVEECQAELRSEIQKAVAAYAEKRFANPLAHKISWNIEPLLPEILADQWQQTRQIDFGAPNGPTTMIWLYGRLRFTGPVQQEIARQYRLAVIQHRLRILAGIGTGLLLLVGLGYGVLRWQCNRLYPRKTS